MKLRKEQTIIIKQLQLVQITKSSLFTDASDD